MGLITAKVTHILWPLSRFGPVEKKPLSDRVKVGYIQPGQDDDYWWRQERYSLYRNHTPNSMQSPLFKALAVPRRLYAIALVIKCAPSIISYYVSGEGLLTVICVLYISRAKKSLTLYNAAVWAMMHFQRDRRIAFVSPQHRCVTYSCWVTLL